MSQLQTAVSVIQMLQAKMYFAQEFTIKMGQINQNISRKSEQSYKRKCQVFFSCISKQKKLQGKNSQGVVSLLNSSWAFKPIIIIRNGGRKIS